AREPVADPVAARDHHHVAAPGPAQATRVLDLDLALEHVEDLVVVEAPVEARVPEARQPGAQARRAVGPDHGPHLGLALDVQLLPRNVAGRARERHRHRAAFPGGGIAHAARLVRWMCSPTSPAIAIGVSEMISET